MGGVFISPKYNHRLTPCMIQCVHLLISWNAQSTQGRRNLQLSVQLSSRTRGPDVPSLYFICSIKVAETDRMDRECPPRSHGLLHRLIDQNIERDVRLAYV